MKKKVQTKITSNPLVRRLKADLLALNRQIEAQERLYKSRQGEADGIEAKLQAVAIQLIQERRELSVRIDGLDILIELSGGAEVGSSPAWRRTR
jgi:hypothetical protein